MRPLVFVLLIFVAAILQRSATAQIVVPTSSIQPVASLSDQLINRLRATTEERQAFVRAVVRRSELGRLDRGLILAVQRYAIRRNPDFPFPFFERAIRYEAAKRGVSLPEVRTFVRSGDLVR